MDNSEESILLRAIKHYLITDHGTVLKKATKEEFYQSFSKSLKERIMMHWTANTLSIEKKKPRMLFYLSMEYLPGRFIDNNILHIGAKALVEKVLKNTPFSLGEIVRLEPDPGLGNGGLGRLASCFLDSLAAMQMPSMGFGLRYQYGIFEQEIWQGVQVEKPDCWLLNQNPWEFRRDAMGCQVQYNGQIRSIQGEPDRLEDYEEIRAIPYDLPIIGFPREEKDFSVVTLRLWSTKESPRNFALQRYNAGEYGPAAENTSLTDVLYPSDHHTAGKRIRLKQEFLLVSASLQSILDRHFRLGGTIDSFSDQTRIQINDTHPALAIVELIRLLQKKDPSLPIEKAFEITKSVSSYTNHTVLKEALEEWNEERMLDLLPRQYRLIQQLNFQFCKDIRKHFPENPEKVSEMSIIEGGQIKMAHLLMYASRKINGVAELHSGILRYLFADFASMYPDKFCNVTNGVSHRKWLIEANPELAKAILDRIGEKWIYDFSQIEKLKEFASCKETQKTFIEVKKKNKLRLIKLLKEQNPIRNEKGEILKFFEPLDVDALFDVQIKRIHEYKRQLLHLLHTATLYLELRKNPKARKCKRMVLLAGKAAPGYENAKHIIHFASILAKKIEEDPKVNPYLRLGFIENYNVSKTLTIIPGSDLSVQISLAGKEASGTGNMKMAMNGALTIGTDDGANVEMREAVGSDHWPFCFGMSASEVRELKGHYNPIDVYNEDPKVREAIDFMVSDELTDHPAEKQCVNHLKKILLEGDFGETPDEYFHLKDFSSYYAAQKKVEELYCNQDKWAEMMIYNIGSMGHFTSDRSIKDYSDSIWHLTPMKTDQKILQEIQQEFVRQ